MWKGGGRLLHITYKSSDGVSLTTKGNTGGFIGVCYNRGKYGQMDWDCTEPRKQEGVNPI